MAFFCSRHYLPVHLAFFAAAGGDRAEGIFYYLKSIG
jgi:hypothetical protein|tara:strand:- start:66 stop:176 length:111 start_codon:yes stop_codon:yes gene_type:complete